MRGFSLTQPWASAVALLLKEWETRSWPTSYRGPVAIHAAKGFPRGAKDFAGEMEMDWGELPIGKIVCVCDLSDCVPTQVLIGKGVFKAREISEKEESWGDYSPERFAFKLDNVRVLPEPIPCRGALGLWNVPPEILAQIDEQLHAKTNPA